MDALELLQSDHQRVSELFEQLHQASDLDQKRDVFEMIRDELTAHAEMEETLFYPLFQSREGFGDLIEESMDDHAEMKDLIEEIDSLDDESELADRFDELQETVDDHVAQEENTLFPKVRQVLNAEEINELGDRMMEFKEAPPRAA